MGHGSRSTSYVLQVYRKLGQRPWLSVLWVYHQHLTPHMGWAMLSDRTNLQERLAVVAFAAAAAAAAVAVASMLVVVLVVVPVAAVVQVELQVVDVEQVVLVVVLLVQAVRQVVAVAARAGMLKVTRAVIAAQMSGMSFATY
jgi:hypothetical protein